jgi:NAD+ synthase
MPVLNVNRLVLDRVESIKSFHKRCGMDRAELDVSGGIDSAVMLMLLAEALGRDKVTAVYSSINSSESSRLRARAVAATAGVKLVELDLGSLFTDITVEVARGLDAAGFNLDEISARDVADKTIYGSFRSCLRAPIGRFLNRLTGGGIRHGTGNEDEDRWLRFYQKGGDGEVDTNPLAMLSKGEVYQLAVALGVPRELILALPSPDLWGCGDQHNDEDELARISKIDWTYSRVDPDSGNYVKVGTIERMNRCLDSTYYMLGKDFDVSYMERILFHEPNYTAGDRSEKWKQKMLDWARPFFPGRNDDDVASFLLSARRWEEITRHKQNPNCPQLGSRKDLLRDGILTNDLPEV